MRRRLITATLVAALALSGCGAGDGTGAGSAGAGGAGSRGAGAQPTAASAADLEREADRLRAEMAALPGVRDADVAVEQDEKSGRAVRGTVTASGGAAALVGVLDRATELGWDTEVFVPQVVEVRVVGDDGVTLDATDLGLPGPAATLTGLHERYGPPAADPDL
ncbi:hypothetical protein V5H98_15370 [Georgenia sp. M64]|uniref:hypothetical protein n=1 Tax=Georgenia sp. M64 TaxID=3120520 RepID=UPI0030E58289